MPPRTPQARSQGRREAILDAALSCFNELGYERASIEDIRARSGASTGSIYHHFGDKQGIAAALFLQGVRHYQSRIVSQLGPDPRRTIRGVVRAHLLWVEENPGLARFLGDRRDLEVVLASEAAFSELNRQLFDAFAGWLKPHVDGGRLRKLSHDAYLSILIGPCDLFARRWLARQTATKPSAIAPALGDAAWRALAGAAAAP